MKYRKLNRLEKKADQKQRRIEALQGVGIYVYKNNTSGTLDLPKATLSGKRTLGKNEEFQGDNYFMQFVPSMLRYIRCIDSGSTPVQENTMTEKLILDQPDKVTTQGTVEHVVAKPKNALNESMPKAEQEMVLITEDPLAGVEIILN